MDAFRFGLLFAPLLVACSSSPSNPTSDGGASTVSGTFDGHAFVAKSALAWVDTVGGQVGFVFDKTVTCSQLLALTPNGTPILSKYDGMYITLDMSGVGESTQVTFDSFGPDGGSTSCSLLGSGVVSVTSLASADAGDEAGAADQGTITFDKAGCPDGHATADGTITYTLCRYQ